jgi:integrase
VAVRKAGDRWVVEFMFRGVRIFRRLPRGEGKQSAQALESRLRSEIFNAVDLGKLPDPPLERVILEWAKGKDAKSRSHINAVLENIGDLTLSQVGQARDKLVSAFADLSPGTVNRRISVLKASAKYAFRKKWTRHNLSAEAALLPEPKYIRREVSGDTAQRLIEAAGSTRAKALIVGAIHTGMRLSELLKWDPKKDIQDGAMRVRDSKNGEDRLVPVPDALIPYLGEFPMRAGWRNIYRGWERARKKAGVTIRFHDLRHFFGTTLAEADYHPKTISELMGHKSLQTTMRYTHPSLDKKREAMGAITSRLQQAQKKKPLKRGS